MGTEMMLKSRAEHDFERMICELFNLPKGTIWCEIRISYDEIPSIKCEYEVLNDEGNPIVDEGTIRTMKEEFDIIVKRKNK